MEEETIAIYVWSKNIIGRNMSGVIKARYENKVLKPLGEINPKDRDEVEIELKKKGIFGLLKGWKIDSQSLKDEQING
jgi:predicted DNA-binding antitoxin AbrB/MazE fold protein